LLEYKERLQMARLKRSIAKDFYKKNELIETEKQNELPFRIF